MNRIYKTVDLHLLSLPGAGEDINFILEAYRPYLAGRKQASVALIQWASVSYDRQ